MNSKFISIIFPLVFITTHLFAVDNYISYKEFKAVALDASENTSSDEECQLQVKENKGGLVLFMRNEDTTASFFVSKGTKIKKVGTSQFDGSYSYDYKVVGEGVLAVVHMDDAYFHVILKSFRNNKITHCDIDF